MTTARFDSPLALVHDRVILVLGGKTDKYHGTKKCDAYDTLSDKWYSVATLPFFCVNTTAVVMKDRFIYLMPGRNSETHANRALMIGYLDTGALDKGLEELGSKPWA